VDVLLGVGHLQEQHLGDDVVGLDVIDVIAPGVGAEKDDSVLQQSRKYVPLALSAASLFPNVDRVRIARFRHGPGLK
jgi:hypothetical protein